MSTTTAPAELEVPREFLPAFVIAANLAVMDRAESIGSDLSLDYTEEGRRADDEALVPMLDAVQDRAAILRAVDDGALVPMTVLRTHVEAAKSHLEGDIHELARNAAKVGRGELERLASTVKLLEELWQWDAFNLRTPEEMAA